MAERLAYLEAVVGADITEFRKSMRDIRNDVGILSETISGIGGAARTMTFAFTAPMVALGTYAVQAASGFDAAMRNINSIMQLSEDKFVGLSAEVMNFAKTTRAGVVPATEALYEIFSAGITDQTKAMEVWKVSNKVAEAGLSDLTQTTNAMTATMSAYNLTTDQATRVGNVWSQMVKMGVGSLGDFLSNSQKILPLSAAMNISLEDMGATLAFLSQGGGGAAKAETAYAMMLSNMMKPTTAMTDALTKLGVKTGTELVAKFGSVSNAVMALRKNVDETTFNKMFSKTGLEAALRITGNIEGMTQATKDFNTALDTATMDAWEQQSKSFAFQWDLMKTSLEAVAITIGQAIMPLITPLVQGFSGFLQQVSDLNPELVQLGVIFVGAVAAAAPLIWLITSLINPIGLVIAGVTALSVAIGTNFDGMRDKVLSAISDIIGGLQPLKDTFDAFMTNLFPKSPEEILPNSPVEVGFDSIVKINPPKGTPPISLYDFYQNEGFSEVTTWTDFMKLATKGGWKGGAIKGGDVITIDTSGLKMAGGQAGSAFRDSFQDKMHDAFGGMGGAGGGSEVKLTIFDRLQNAITAAWPKLQTALDSMWTNFSTWVTGTAIPKIDSFAGQVLGAISNWFDTSSSDFSGGTAVYDAVSGVMTTDVGGAAQDAAKNFQKSFPQLTAGLSTLFNNVANWITAEGLPTLARSIGFVAGRMASLFRDAISGLWSSISGSGVSVKGATDAAKTTMIDPLMQGISDGIGEAGNKNPFDAFTDKMSAMLLLALGTWVLTPTVVSAIAAPVITAITTAMTGVMVSPTILGSIARLVAGIGTGMATAFGALSVLGIGAIIIAALLSNEDIQNGLKAWSGVWENLKLIAAIALNSIITKFMDMGRDLSSTLADIQMKVATAKLIINPNDAQAQIDFNNANITLQTNNLSQQLEDSVNGYLAGKPLNVNIPGLVATITGANGEQAAAALAAQITDPVSLSRAITKAMASNDTGALQMLIPVQIAYEGSKDPTATTTSQMIQLMKDTGLSPEDVAAFLTTYYRDNPAKVSEIEVALQYLKVKPADNTTVDTSAVTDGKWISNAYGSGNQSTTGGAAIPINIDAKPIMTGATEATKAWADSVVKDMPANVQAAITANAGNMTAAASSMTEPFVTAFNTAFAPETGTVTAQWKTFLTNYITDLNTLQTTTSTQMPLVQSSMVTAFDAIKNSIDKANQKMLELAGTLNGLVSHSPYKVVVNVETNGQAPTLPAGATGTATGGDHGAVGINRVPYDNYLINAHKGEKLLTKSEADDYKAGNALPRMQPAMNVDNSSPTMIINGVQDFDQFLREAKRRGYNLDKYRK